MFKIEKNNDIILTRGDTARMKIRLVQHNRMYREVEADDVLTLTVREKLSSEEKLFSVNNVDLSLGYNTEFLKISPDDTIDIDPGVYVYDVQLNTASGDVYTIVGPCKFILTEGVTRP